MNRNYAIAKILSIPSGRWFKAQYTTDVPLSAQGKKMGAVVLKRTVGVFRLGINYANLKSNKGKDIQPLPWGNYKEGTNGRIIEYTNKQGQYNLYARFYFSPNKPKSSYFLNGAKITKENLKNLGIVLNSYFNSNNKSECFTINLNNLEVIN